MRRRIQLGVFGAVLGWLLWGCAPTEQPLPTLAARVEPVPLAELRFWEAQTARLTPTLPRAEWQFTAQANDVITLRAVENGASTRLTLFDFLGNVLAEGDSIETPLATAGVYRVQVEMVGDGISEVTVGLGYADRPNPLLPTPIEVMVGVPTPTPDFGDRGRFIQAILPLIPANHVLTADTPRHIYTFNGVANQFISLELTRMTGTLDPFLTLYDVRGNRLAVDDNSAGNTNARLANVRLPETGVYQVQVWGGDYYGDYSLLLREGFYAYPPDALFLPTATPELAYATPTLGALPENTRLQDHAPIVGEIGVVGGFARYAFYADSGETFTLSVLPLGDSRLRPLLEIYTPEGLLLVTSRASTANFGGGAVVRGIQVNESGAYVVLVMGEDKTAGGFSLAFGKGNTTRSQFMGETSSNVRSTGTIARDTDRHEWVIRLNAGDVINVAVTATPFLPSVTLVTLEGLLVSTGETVGESNATLIRAVQAPVGGRYLLRIASANGAIGDYTLLWRYVNLAQTATPQPKLQTALSVSDWVAMTDYNFYPFYGDAGQKIEIAVTAQNGSPLDAVLAVFAPDGTLIAEADDSAGTLNPFVTLTLPQQGTYLLRVNGYLSGGAFDITVKTWLP